MSVLKKTALAGLAAAALFMGIPAKAAEIEQVGRAAYLEAMAG